MQNDRRMYGGYGFWRLADKEPEAKFGRSADLSVMPQKKPQGFVQQFCRIQEGLEKAPKRYADPYNSAPVGFMTLSEAGLILGANLTIANLLGCERSFLIGKAFPRFITEDTRDNFFFHCEKLTETRAAQTCELKLTANGGDPLRIRLKSILLKDIENQPTQIRTTISEITERKQVKDEAGRKSRERLERISELHVINRLTRKATAKQSLDQFPATAADHIISHLKPDLIILHLVHGDRLLLKWSESKNPERIHEGPEEEALKEFICGLEATGKPVYSTDIRNDPFCTLDECKKAGIRSFAALPLQCGNKVLGVLGLASLEIRDFSRQRALLETLADQIAMGLENIRLNEESELQAEELKESIRKLELAGEEIRKSRELLQCVFDGISDPLIMVDQNMKVTALNTAATGHYRVSSREAIGKTCYEIFGGRTESCECCNVTNALSSMEPSSFQTNGFGDTDRLERVDIYPFADSRAEGGAILQITDITSQTQHATDLMLADKLISLGVLVSGVAHEINNPNNFIMLNAPTLKKAWESIEPIIEKYYRENGDFIMGGLEYSEMRDEIPGLLSGIMEGSRRIEGIVKDLKDYSRHDSIGRTQLVDVNKAIESSVRLLDHMLRKSSNHFSVEFGENLPSINGNVQKLEQVVINLIQNACQALTNNGQCISVKSSYHKKKNGIVIEVRDEGVGIPTEELPRIMEPFFSTKQGYGGTGLGLSVCSDIIKEHQGKIDVESREGAGSTFRVFLPVTKKAKQTRILVVDDDDILREGITNVLKTNKNYRVEEASNGAEAFLLIGHRRPDLIVLDIHMPDMDGVEVCRLLKEMEELSDIKVVVITGFPDSPKGRKVVELGFTNILPKPFTIPDLTGMVKIVLEEVPL